MLSPKDISDLEERYKKYTFKKRFKIFLYILFLAILSLFFTYYYLNISSKKINKKQKERNSSLASIANNITAVKTKKKVILIHKKSTILKKVKKESNEKKSYFEDLNSSAKPVAPINTQKMKSEKNIEKKDFNSQFIFKLLPSDRLSVNHNITHSISFYHMENESKSNLDLNNGDEKPKIKIIMKDINSISYLKKKFNKTNDIIFALMLCENYYGKKDFKNSLRWSIIANDIDSSSERSWIWFAKSKYRLHQKRDAIKALKAFLKTNDSQDVRILLRDIVNGVLND